MTKITSFSLPTLDESQIPMAFLNSATPPKKGVVMAADIGGTKTNLAIFEIKDGELILIKEQSYPTKKYKSFIEMVRTFLTAGLPVIDSVCLGIAGPVTEGKVHGTNFPWEIDSKEIGAELDVRSITLINDMEANAYGLAALHEKDFETLKYGFARKGNVAIISPGTGLGEAGLFWDGSHYHPFASEGGHCDFSPRNNSDLEIWQYLLQKYGHVSWERLISGPGIVDTYQLMRRVSGESEPEWFQEKILKEDPAAVITQAALDGKDPVCVQTLELFVRFLAIESAQLALKLKATGGIYIGGGIVPKIIKGVNREVFYGNFIQSGRMNSLLQMVPVKVILNEKAALLGTALYGALLLGNK
tara:strand:+ start:75 stop:1151 length:1077 start_codon:yes stop_codon:yes gene_type:complete